MCALLWSCVLSLSLGGTVGAEDRLIVGFDQFPPHHYEENGVVKGPHAVLVGSVVERAGTPYVLRVYPWKRLYSMEHSKGA